VLSVRRSRGPGAKLWSRRLLWSLLLCVVALSETAHSGDAVAAPWILVDTKTRTLSVFSDNIKVERFDNIAIGRGGVSADKVRDDGTTPLGTFHIDHINLNSPFLTFFGFDYPRPEHARRALAAGRIDAEAYRRIVDAFKKHTAPPQDTPLGGQLGIHGLGSGDRRIHNKFDWTQGCIALTNEQLERLSQWVYLGMRVEVR
jgi:L,D-transpeptidase catalytic domain